MGNLRKAKVIIGNPVANADLFWVTKFFAPDAYTYIEIGNERIVLLSTMEMERAKSFEHFRVLPQEDYCKAGEELLKFSTMDFSNEIAALHAFFNERKIKRVTVQKTLFGCGYADELRALGYTVSPIDDFFPERRSKNLDEIRFILQAMAAAEKAMGEAVALIRDSWVDSEGFLRVCDVQLTSETLRNTIESTLRDFGFEAVHGTIVASGAQSAIPHEVGSGPIRAGEPIIVDIFPQSPLKSGHGYWGDITRTFCKSPVPEALRKMYDDVLAAQEAALSGIRVGMRGNKAYELAAAVLQERGHPVFDPETGTPKAGFIHGLGHGLGIEIHEPPFLLAILWKQFVLQLHDVVTVEPGLYYPGLGGVRIEDTIVVTKDGYQNLTEYPKKLEIP